MTGSFSENYLLVELWYIFFIYERIGLFLDLFDLFL